MSFYVVDHFIDTTVYDESIVVPSDPILPKKLIFLQAIFASKGKANVIKDISVPSLMRSTYGSDIENLDKYGQGGINVIHGMNGGASAQICRLLPENATQASFTLSVLAEPAKITQYERDAFGKFKLDNNGDRIPIKIQDPDNLSGPHIDKKIDGLKFTLIGKEGNLTDDNDGKIITTKDVGSGAVTSTLVPIYKMIYYSKGKCGSDIGHQLTNDFLRDDAVGDGRRYSVQFFERELTGNIVRYGQPVYFALNPEAVINPSSTVLETLSVVYPDYDENGNEKEIKIKPFIEKNYESLKALIDPFVDVTPSTTGDDITAIDIDFINCLDKNGNPYDQFINGDGTVVNEINYADSVKFLIGGSDGSLQLGATVSAAAGGSIVVDNAHVEATKKSLLQEFFKGKIDQRLLDERFVDADIYVDANYEIDVKREMLGKFRVLRPDIFVVADIGFAADPYAAIPLVKEIYGMVDGATGYSASVIVHSGSTLDRAIPIKLTATYDYAYGLAKCYGQFGTFSVFAGYQQAKVTTMRMEWYPFKDELDTMIGPFQKLGCIFALEIVKDRTWAYMSEDNMYVEKYSKLKSSRNGMVIGDAIRMGKKILIKYIYDNEGAEGAIRKATEEMLNTIVGRYPTNINVSPNMYRTPRDIQLDTSTCDIVYEFPGMTKGWSYNIYARRSASDAAAVAA
jgi:hypothetical protein